MKVTNVRIHWPPMPPPNLKAFASVTLDNRLVLNDIRIILTRAGNLRIFFPIAPTRKDYHPVYCPINDETRVMIQDAVLEAYRGELRE